MKALLDGLDAYTGECKWVALYCGGSTNMVVTCSSAPVHDIGAAQQGLG